MAIASIQIQVDDHLGELSNIELLDVSAGNLCIGVRLDGSNEEILKALLSSFLDKAAIKLGINDRGMVAGVYVTSFSQSTHGVDLDFFHPEIASNYDRLA